MGIRNHILAASLAASAMGAQASDVFERETIRLDDPRVAAMCKQFQNKTGILLDGKEICEYSIDNGKSWVTTKGVALGVAALLGLGASGYGMIRLRRKRKGDWELAERDTTISDAQRNADEKNEGEIIYTIFNPDNQDSRLKRVTEFIESKKFKPAEIQLGMMLKTYPGRTDLHIKKLELYFTKGDSQAFEDIYKFIVNTIDPLKELIPQETYLLMKDWGREIDPTNPLYDKSESMMANKLVNNSGENEVMSFDGISFDGIYKGGENIALGYSDGGKDFMQDYVSYVEEEGKVTMIVLDGVSSGEKGVTEKFVQDAGEKLEIHSLKELLTSESQIMDFPPNVGATVGKVTIENGVLNIEKVGDVGILIFDKEGRILRQDIGGGYIPDSWYGSAEEVDIIEGQDIVNEIRKYGFTDVPQFEENMTKGQFMKAYECYTKQIGGNTANAQPIEYTWILNEGDTVVLATDGVFDNISLNRIIELVNSGLPVSQGVFDVLAELDILNQVGLNNFGNRYKQDNIGLSIYRYTVGEREKIEVPTVSEEPILQVLDELGGTQADAMVAGLVTEIQEHSVPQSLNMEEVKRELQGEKISSDEEADIKLELSNRPKDAKLLTRLITHTIERYGFESSENGENITFNVSKSESILYYLDENDEVISSTEFSIGGVVKIATLGKGYIEVTVKNPEFKRIKILLTTPEVK